MAVALTLRSMIPKAFALDTIRNDRLLLSWMGLLLSRIDTNKDKDGNVGICIQSVSRCLTVKSTQSPLTPMLGEWEKGTVWIDGYLEPCILIRLFLLTSPNDIQCNGQSGETMLG